MANKKPGEIIAKRIEAKGYSSYTQFRRDFLKKASVTLSGSALSMYIHGNVPSKERFDALTDFLGFSKKEKEDLEAMYQRDLRHCAPYFPGVKKKAKTKESKPRRKGVRMDIPKKPGEKKWKRKTSKKKAGSARKQKAPVAIKVSLFDQLCKVYKDLTKKKKLTKRQQVLIFELSLK